MRLSCPEIDVGQLAALVPGLAPGVVDIASFSSVEGTGNPRVATRALLVAARAMGTAVEHPVTLIGFDAANGAVRVLSQQGALEVDAVVLAAGLGCMPLAAMLGAKVPIESSPGVLAHIEPGRSSFPAAFGPGANMKQPTDGSFVTGASFAGTPDMPATRATGEALLADARAYLPALAGLKLAEVTLGHECCRPTAFRSSATCPAARTPMSPRCIAA